MELERGNLEQVLYMDYYNDIAVMVNDQFILMIEHQSTINPNMPLRLLEYVTRIYGNKVDSKTKFSNKLIPLAKPEFFVFYTGKENIPPESYLYLSDAFPKDTSENQLSDSELTLELVVKVCKIKGEEPSQIVQNCPDLEQYVQFLKLIDKAKSDGQAQPLTRAIREAVRHNILKDYLERKGGETLSILTAEYDFDTAMAVKQEEAYAEGISIGLERGIERGLEQGRLEGLERGAYQNKLETAQLMIGLGIPLEQVQLCTNLPLDVVQGLIQNQ